MRWASSTAGTAAGRAGPPPSPGLLVQLSLVVQRRAPRRVRDGRHMARDAGGVAAFAAAQLRRGRLRRMGRRARAPPGLVRARASTTPPGPRQRSSDRPARRPSPRLYRAAHADCRSTWCPPVRVHTLPSGAVVADFGAVYAAAPAGQVRQRRTPAAPSPGGWGTCSTPTARCRRCTAHRGRTFRSPTSWVRGPRSSRASPTAGSATSRSTTPASPWAPASSSRSPATRRCRTRRWRPSRRATARSTPSGSSTRTRACTAARSSSSTPRRGRRVSSSGTPRTSRKA